MRVGAAGATAADSADGDSGVTPLGDQRGGRAVIFSDGGSFRPPAFPRLGLVAQDLVDRFSVTGFSLSDLSSAGATLGCSVMLGSTVAAGAAAVIDGAGHASPAWRPRRFAVIAA